MSLEWLVSETIRGSFFDHVGVMVRLALSSDYNSDIIKTESTWSKGHVHYLSSVEIMKGVMFKQ